MTEQEPPVLDLELLTALGFGPDASLMNEPRLFIDRHFLASLVIELEEEFSQEMSKSVLFQIGLMHGMRDASRIVSSDFLTPNPPPVSPSPESTPLAIRLGAQVVDASSIGIEIPGAWPEGFEAEARLAKVGPSDGPSCYLSAGYTSGWLSGILDAEILVLEQSCACSGGEQCQFVAREVDRWRSEDDPWISALITAIPFDAVRNTATRSLPSQGTRTAHYSQAPSLEELDSNSADIHVWGPVMILPFLDPDTTLQTTQQLGHEAETCHIRVVVVDLRDRMIDDFEAATLEMVLETVESWGAEVILTGVSQFSEAVVQEIEATHLLLCKNLPEAIATAFQVSEAQRHLV